MRNCLFPLAMASALSLIACTAEAPKESPPVAAKPAPAPPAAAPQPDAGRPDRMKMVENPDGLSLADRIAKRKVEDDKLATELAKAEHDRLLKFDKSKLSQHTAMFAFLKKTRKQYDDLAEKAKGKPDAKDQLDKLREAVGKVLPAQSKALQAIDPKQGNSNIVTDHDVVLNALSNDYPAAIAAWFDGDEGPLKAQRAEIDSRAKKIEEWLAEAKKAK